MDCEIVMEDAGQLTERLLEEIHRKCGFRRLFIRQTLGPGENCTGLVQLGFMEHQRIPMTRTRGEWIPLLLQPYADVQVYEAVFAKTFP